MAKQELDSFDKLLLALSREGFGLPFMSSVRTYPKTIDNNPQDVAKADKEAWQQNRSALITAMTNSEWIAQ